MVKKWISRKFLAAVGGIITLILVKKGGLPEEMAKDLIEGIVQILTFYLVGQGVVDAAKEIKNGGKG